ncbi:hypothetical protein [Aestuariivita boseongensis]|uniref:hypothetical protein n=1 Tax=Aestuariivita boseongensis TaxID=1470562 RepID=UPI00068113C5|nr:hypothetical protein [Aestuariivita boseongensis]
MDIERRLKPFVKKAFPILSAFHKYRREYKLLHRDVEYREALGFYFNGSPAMEQGVFEPDETQVFHKIIEKFDLLVNIGANAGYYVCKALDA